MHTGLASGHRVYRIIITVCVLGETLGLAIVDIGSVKRVFLEFVGRREWGVKIFK